MKILAAIAIVLITTTSAYSWMNLVPDYKKQFLASDLVAVVCVMSISDTGSKKQLDENSRLQFRGFEVEMEIVSPFKGGASRTLNCRLFRFPTKRERDADLGERDANREYLTATPWESGVHVRSGREIRKRRSSKWEQAGPLGDKTNASDACLASLTSVPRGSEILTCDRGPWDDRAIR